MKIIIGALLVLATTLLANGIIFWFLSFEKIAISVGSLRRYAFS